MSATKQQPAAAHDTRASIFGRILVGVDDSPESLEAARQAVALATGTVTLLAAYDVTHAVVGAGMAPVPVGLDEAPFRERAVEALERTRQELAPIAPVGKIARGRAWQVLLDEITHGEDTLVALGSHGAGRAKGILDRLDRDRARPQGPVLGARGAQAADGLPELDRRRSRRVEGVGGGRGCRPRPR
jgi:nucleotide-binding universal stress UspA family protein